MDTVCFDRTYLILLVVVVTIIAVYNYFSLTDEIIMARQSCAIRQQNNDRTRFSQNERNQQNSNNQQRRKIHVDINSGHSVPHHPIHSEHPYRTYDKKALLDPLTPPWTRDDYNTNPALLYPSLYSIPTRGAPGTFKRLGTVVNEEADNNDKFKFMILMGRSKYLGSNRYEYYVINSSSDSNLKFDLEKLNKELYTDDTITIPQLGEATYKVSIDKTLGHEYSPVIF